MDPPDRLTVPTCVGCGAMNRFGTCSTGCSEHRLELVRAAAYEWCAVRSRVLPVLEEERRMRGLVQRLAWAAPREGEWERNWRALKAEAERSFSQPPSSLQSAKPG